jgi:hypothetical protein
MPARRMSTWKRLRKLVRNRDLGDVLELKFHVREAVVHPIENPDHAGDKSVMPFFSSVSVDS